MGDESDFFGGVRALLGDRLGDYRLEDGRWLSVTVIDLDEADDAAIRRLADELDVTDRVRIERADPEHLAQWERLRHDLIALRGAQPGVLQSSPTSDPGHRRPPIRIGLAVFAEDVAAGLHDRYGDFVELTVGALPYPPDSRALRRSHRAEPRIPADPTELRVEPADPLVVTSGSATTRDVLLTTMSSSEIVVHTNGHVTAEIADPADGLIIGGYSGMQAQPLVVSRVAPGETRRIPVLIGTASFTPDLGYAVPAGEWILVVPLRLDDGRVLEARLPLTIERPS